MRCSALFCCAGLVLSGCGPADKGVTVSGTVSYAEYRTGNIEMKLVEDITQDCKIFSSCSSKTPGDTVARLTLARPGDFSMKAEVQGSRMYLLAYALGEKVNFWECEAGGMQSLDVGDVRNLSLTLVSGECPALE
jgi:hypothetical protein